MPDGGAFNLTDNTLKGKLMTPSARLEEIEEFDLPIFNEGQFLDAVRRKSEAEAITQFLVDHSGWTN